jgi:hypothetical protein
MTDQPDHQRELRHLMGLLAEELKGTTQALHSYKDHKAKSDGQVLFQWVMGILSVLLTAGVIWLAGQVIDMGEWRAEVQANRFRDLDGARLEQRLQREMARQHDQLRLEVRRMQGNP